MYEIINRLYLGKKDDIKKNKIEFYNINCIINCTKDLPFDESCKNISTLRIPIDDNNSKDTIVSFLKILPITIKKIDRAINNNKSVLVCCQKARQRSCTVIAAYLIWKKCMTPNEAILFIKGKKWDAFIFKASYYDVLLIWHNFIKNTVLPN